MARSLTGSGLLPFPKAASGLTPAHRQGPNAVIGDCSPRLRRAADRLPPMGLSLRFDVATTPTPVPRLADSYAYRLSMDGAGARVSAATEWGALAALATLVQATAADLDIRSVDDAPRYPWRGLMIDTARHFISLPALRRTVDAMWFYKLNVLHLHLSDDQAFRLRGETFPELASVDAYSADELREFVRFAADRGVRVVPELDMPGHVTSWLPAKPAWAAPGVQVPKEASSRFGVHRAALDVDKPEVMAAVDALLAELADVFPDENVHFGGDEVVSLTAAQQGRFHRWVVDRLSRLGKRAIGWDECLGPALPTGAIVQTWRSAAARDTALAAGHDCIVSSPYYLDLNYPADLHFAADPAGDLVAWEAEMPAHPRLAHVKEGVSWLAAATDFPELPRRTPGTVLGGEACLWSELVTDSLLDTRLWSRMPAVADRLWGASPQGTDLYERMAASRAVLADLGIVPLDAVEIPGEPGLQPLLDMLEPVKWYRRLLGVGGYERRLNGLGVAAEARPYDANTALNRIVDQLPPESLASRRAEADLASGASMCAWVSGWRSQAETLAAAEPQLQSELGTASAALAALADVVEGKSDRDPTDLAGPHGEYLLPVAYAVKARE